MIHGGIAHVVSPGSLVDIYGTGLTSNNGSYSLGQRGLPLSLGSVQAVVDAAPAPLLYASNDLVIFQMPTDATPGVHTISVFANGGVSAPVKLLVQQAAPSILTYGAGRAVSLNSDLSVNSSSNCAPQGSTAVVYAIGSGPVDNPVPSGMFTPLAPLSRETLETTVLVNGTPSAVRFSGLAPTLVGVVQINFDVPATTAGDGTLQIAFGATKSNVAAFCVAN